MRPIDTQAWIQHTNAMRGMPSIVEGEQHNFSSLTTPLFQKAPQRQYLASGHMDVLQVAQRLHRMDQMVRIL